MSSSVPEADWQSPLAKSCSAEYLTNNLVSPVLFEEACKHIPENAIVLEIAPHGLLQAILKRSLSPQNTNISMTLRSKEPNAVNFLLASIGKWAKFFNTTIASVSYRLYRNYCRTIDFRLFIAGCQPDVNALFPPIEYPVPRGTPSISPLATWDHTHDWGCIEPMKDKPLSGELIHIKLNKGCVYNFIAAHQIQDRKVIPPSLYMVRSRNRWFDSRYELYLRGTVSPRSHYSIWLGIFSQYCETKKWEIRISYSRRYECENTFILLWKVSARNRNSKTWFLRWGKLRENEFPLIFIFLESRNLMIMIHKGSGNFEVLLDNEKDPDNPKVLMSGIIRVPFENVEIKFDEDQKIQAKNKLNKEEFYEKLKKVGYKLEDEFITLQQLSFNDTGNFYYFRRLSPLRNLLIENLRPNREQRNVKMERKLDQFSRRCHQIVHVRRRQHRQIVIPLLHSSTIYLYSSFWNVEERSSSRTTHFTKVTLKTIDYFFSPILQTTI